MAKNAEITTVQTTFVSEVMHELTPQEEQFAQALVKGYNLKKSVRLALDKPTMSDKDSYEQARKWRENVAVRTRITELRRELYEYTQMQFEEGLEILAGMVRTNIHDLLEFDGSLRQLSDIPDYAVHAIEKIKFAQRYERRTVEKYDEILGTTYTEEVLMPISVVSEIDLTNKQAALDKIIKVMGGYKADNEQKAPNVTVLPMDIFENPLDDEQEQEHGTGGSPAN